MASKTEIAKALLQMALGMGVGGVMRGGPSLLSIASGASFTPGVPGGADAFMAKQYPTEFAPDRYHNYQVVNIPGDANMNQFGKSYSDTIDEAGRMQTLKEHNDAIKKYIRPGMKPKELRSAVELGIADEKRLPQFWNESESRRPFKVSSSAVTGIRLTPDARIEVQWKNSPKWYVFSQYPDTQQASVAAQELLKADSIGRAVYPVISRKVNNPLLGSWNRKNYDGAFA